MGQSDERRVDSELPSRITQWSGIRFIRSHIDSLWIDHRIKNKILKQKTRLSKMPNEKKELIKSFKIVIEDLLDNYEKYTDEEKSKIRDLFEKVSDLNEILDKYDIQTEFNWQEYFAEVGRYFGGAN